MTQLATSLANGQIYFPHTHTHTYLRFIKKKGKIDRLQMACWFISWSRCEPTHIFLKPFEIADSPQVFPMKLGFLATMAEEPRQKN